MCLAGTVRASSLGTLALLVWRELDLKSLFKPPRGSKMKIRRVGGWLRAGSGWGVVLGGGVSILIDQQRSFLFRNYPEFSLGMKWMEYEMEQGIN